MKKSQCALCIVLAAVFLLSSCSASHSGSTDTTQSAYTPVTPVFDSDDLFSSRDVDGTVLFDGNVSVTGDGLSVSGEEVTVTAAGTYTLTGSSANGRIIVDCSKNDDVILILDNLSLGSENAPVIWCKKAGSLTVSLPQDSSSALWDSASRSDSDTPDSAVYSKCDLIFNGSGTLFVTGNANNAVQSKDYITVLECTLNITSVDDGIVGKDGLEISAGAVINANCDGDGLRSTNDDSERGTIYLGECTLNIDSGADAVQAATVLTVESGADITVTTGGGASFGKSHSNGFGHPADSGTSVSSKGLKAENAIFVSGGNISANCADDAIHCNGDVHITGGTFILATGDDGIHADSKLTVENGSITVSESYEGLEANVITVSGGTIDITAEDDGINVAGGNDSSSTGGMWGNDIFAVDESCLLTISGGCITVNASGDGVDSNGSIVMSGGELYISGPVDNGNGTLDFNGDFEITGGTLLGVGSSGMAQVMNCGTQASVSATVSGSVSAGSVLTLKTANGDTIASITAPKSYSFIVASSPMMNEGDLISIYLDDELLGTLTASVNIGSSGGMSFPGGNPGGHGGHGGRR